jgi:hypothetical protein
MGAHAFGNSRGVYIKHGLFLLLEDGESLVYFCLILLVTVPLDRIVLTEVVQGRRFLHHIELFKVFYLLVLSGEIFISAVQNQVGCRFMHPWVSRAQNWHLSRLNRLVFRLLLDIVVLILVRKLRRWLRSIVLLLWSLSTHGFELGFFLWVI